MNPEILEKIKADLLQQQKQLVEEMSGIGQGVNLHRGPDIPDYGTESDENAQEVEQYTTNLEADKVLEKTKADIDSALKSIEDGSYGICKYCGNEIEEKRLLIRPFSSSCVSCKTKLQQN
ncbi:TraR/DksA family transcriptional regulator [Candidatus Falkowbacteria bacterium]|nr:MAG: TraR/DksA family transcriptional regulator [Candidatus Falkowbacteria bacterium]